MGAPGIANGCHHVVAANHSLTGKKLAVLLDDCRVKCLMLALGVINLRIRHVVITVQIVLGRLFVDLADSVKDFSGTIELIF